MEDRGTYIDENDLFDVSFEHEISHVLVREENPGVNDHVSPSFEVVCENQQKMEHPEVNENINNDNLSVEDSVNINDGPGGPDVATSSISKRKKCALALIISVALLALIIGLSAGLGGKNGERSTTSSANSALTLEDCLAEAAAAGSVPTSMPTDNSNFPTSDSIIAGQDEEDAAIGQSSMLVDEFVATGVSNDIPVEEEEIPSEETGEAVSSEEPPRPSNDVDDIDFLVRRDLRGNIEKSATANKVKEHTPASKSRRLQCQELLADQTPKDGGIESVQLNSKASKSKGGKSSEKTYLDVAADWVNPNGKPAGDYFVYSESDWVEVFGGLTNGNVYAINQCRDGTQVWTGNVKVWVAGMSPAHGRRDPFSAGAFETGDIFIPSTESCPKANRGKSKKNRSSRKKYLDLGADWVNRGSPAGDYFVYSESDWVEVFGGLTTGSVYTVNQCRDGTQVWTGNVKVWVAGNLPAHGRRDPFSASAFETGDIFIPSTESCPKARRGKSSENKYLDVSADWVNPNNGSPAGDYFLYSESDWVEVFVGLTTGSVYTVNQCRDDTLVWTGNVKVWVAGNLPAHGRRDPFSASAFETGDIFIPSTESCL